jgi:hypothetical protein
MRDRKLSPMRDQENAARGLSTFLLVAPFGSSRDGGRDAKDVKSSVLLCVLSLATTTSDSRRETVRPVLSILSRL